MLNRHNGMNVLKAFSFFKTRQKSNMQLIITADNTSSNDSLIENLKTYKYRKEVHLFLRLQEKELAKITAGAYALLYPALYEGMPLIPLQAMQCDVPVIASKTGALIELYPGSVLYIDP
jgi:glycosyltransferase involved in cell wall biosynthesis